MTNNTTAPALTDEQIVEIYDDFYTQEDERESSHILPFARALERALLTSPRAAVPAPEGWKLVPIEPTDEMVESGHAEYERALIGNRKDIGVAFLRRWAAMLDAAPAAPVADLTPAENAELASMTRMFHAACTDLGLINEALGLDPDDGGAEPILDAIQKLKNERDQWADAGYAAQAVAADGAAQDDIEGIARAAGCTNVDLIGDRAKAIERLTAFAGRVRAAVSPATAESKCTRCGASTAQACNELGCFYLESGDGEPATADERAAFVDAYLRTFPPESLESAPRAARGIAESIASNNGSAFQLWLDGAAFARASQAAAPADARIKQLERSLDEVMIERDEYEDTADKLAAAIAKYLGVDIGEHSNLNCPWSEALEAIENARPVAPADAGEAASIENPLTPYGMLVRALRIVAGTTLMDMSTAMNVSPAFLSSLEFGRRPVSFDNATLASQFFSERGIVDTQPALVRAAKESQGAQGGKGGDRADQA
ncbi:helix-turn-helix domain-containing protein [Burkholderia gladioli]|uniref:helix-turn-helix domain-containing protein n=1 Tax=Burkholderia gladioli TaxID=28095 RepID=UPI00163FF476|nr:helix-turn-helix transcriptional regulator [Burkholderia gladioli]